MLAELHRSQGAVGCVEVGGEPPQEIMIQPQVRAGWGEAASEACVLRLGESNHASEVALVRFIVRSKCPADAYMRRALSRSSRSKDEMDFRLRLPRRWQVR